MRVSRLTTIREKRLEDIKKLLLESLDGTHAEVTGLPPEGGFIYKGFIHTPLGVYHFDTISTSKFIPADRARKMFTVWKKKAWPGQKIKTIDLIRNWKDNDCWKQREFAWQLINRYFPEGQNASE